MPSDRLFGPAASTDAMLETVGDTAWVAAMLEAEAALAHAEARTGLLPVEAADAIAACCRFERFDIAQIGRDAVSAGTPVVPLVKALTALAPPEAARYVHWGATSQDILDTAMMLIARRGLDLIERGLGDVARICAQLAERHRATILPARTLLQQALPTTLGLKAAGWLVGVVEARARVRGVRRERLAVQLGGAAGTLAALGEHGPAVVHELSIELGLAAPVLPWHTARGRVVELGEALGLAAGTVAKIALDVALLAQTEVAEVSEAEGVGRGGSSTLPQKRNPVGAVAALACARGVRAQVGLLLGTMEQEHERAAGAWQAEWPAVAEAFRLTAGAVARTVEALDGLEVHTEKMREDVDLTGGLLLAEHVMMTLAERIGRQEAQAHVQAAAAESGAGRRGFREALLADPEVARHLSAAEIDAALNPARYLGSAGIFIDRALAAYEADAADVAARR